MKQCAAFWNHTNLRSDNRIFPCCRFKKPVQVFDGNVGNILHSAAYRKLRSLTTTENLPECSKCWQEEKLGKKSLRQWFNENYTTLEVSLKYFEIGFDNICNLTCDGCWEEWSSSWFVKKNPNSKVKLGIKTTLPLTNIPAKIEKIVFLGGEPLMTSKHRNFLLAIGDLSNIEVEYFTNGMFDLLEADHDVLKTCKVVRFNISVDGFGSLNDTVRQGSSWKQIEAFVNEVKNFYQVVINSVIHKNNWHGIIDLYNWIEVNKFFWKINVLTYPAELSIANLSDRETEALKDLIKDYNIPDKKYILEFLHGR